MLRLGDLTAGMACCPIGTLDKSRWRYSVFKKLGYFTPTDMYIKDRSFDTHFWVNTADYEFLVDGVWQTCQMHYELNPDWKFPYWHEVNQGSAAL